MRALVAAVAVLALAATLGAGPTEEERIETVIEAVIEAYQAGDAETLARHYAPEVTMIPADYGPPVVGWTNVAQRYQQAYAQLGKMELLRENTRILRRGKLAWATYQWRAVTMVGKELREAQGHTTLILEKRGGHWVILHNHTSLAAMPPEPKAAPPPTAAPPR
ncbi:MAG: SgcJ/EcaC family oxidoreductase [Acidobacteria bacterium]|nr:SgcJ/EcaC family oxidoreductase [Acidobacteriota bacterium]